MRNAVHKGRLLLGCQDNLLPSLLCFGPSSFFGPKMWAGLTKPRPCHGVSLFKSHLPLISYAVPAGCYKSTHLPLAMQANVKARFQYQRTTFPQISGDGSAYVESVGGHVKLGIRVANDGAGRPLVCPVL